MLQDFAKHFDQFELCNLSPDSLTDPSDDDVTWCVNVFNGDWVKDESAGGCRSVLVVLQ